MSEEAYNIALKNTLAEIKNVCPEITRSFIFTKDGTMYTEDEQTNNPATEKAANSLKTLVERASAVGGLDNVLIDGDDGNVYVSCIDDMYLVMVTSKDADIAYLRNITGVIFPTVLKLLKTIVTGPTPLKPEPSPPEEKLEIPEVVSAKPSEQPSSPPSQQLIVDKLGGLLVKADTVQVDQEILNRWRELLSTKDVDGVEIESFAGKTAQCKVKRISDSKLEGMGLIRIPEKTCQTLEVRKGELVRVKPIISQGGDAHADKEKSPRG